MAVRDILLLGNAQLYKESTKVKRGELDKLMPVFEDLQDTLLDFRERFGWGRAIAAPQIGILKRIVYMHVNQPVVLINPVIKLRNRRKTLVWDDCMSFPDLMIKVKRYRRCKVEYRDTNWRKQSMYLESKLAALMQQRRCRTLIGCASIAMDDGGANALSVWRRLARTHLAPDANRVFPRRALPRLADVPETRDAAPAVIPALLKGYLRVGAWIGGEPAWDEAFGTADLFVMMPLERVEGRYARHYLKAA